MCQSSVTLREGGRCVAFLNASGYGNLYFRTLVQAGILVQISGLLFMYLFLAVLHSLQELSSPTKDRTCPGSRTTREFPVSGLINEWISSLRAEKSSIPGLLTAQGGHTKP